MLGRIQLQDLIHWQPWRELHPYSFPKHLGLDQPVGTMLKRNFWLRKLDKIREGKMNHY